MAKCGECLMNDVEIVELNPDGSCPRCGVTYSFDDVQAATVIEQTTDRLTDFVARGQVVQTQIDATDRDRVDRMVAEVRTLGPMDLQLQPQTVFELVGLLQLAKRHSKLSVNNRATIERFLSGARDYFHACPTILDVIAMGDRPDFDR